MKCQFINNDRCPDCDAECEPVCSEELGDVHTDLIRHYEGQAQRRVLIRAGGKSGRSAGLACKSWDSGMVTSRGPSCPLCGCHDAPMVYETTRKRAYECQQCGAIGKITKGDTSWWYHGWQALDDDDKPGFRVDGDGKKFRAPIHYLDWANLATEGNLEVLNFT